jgi:1,2-diacylglycerol 3-beta-glucosyltransferase
MVDLPPTIWLVLGGIGLLAPTYALLLGYVARRPIAPGTGDRDGYVVFCLVPCLNEGRVVGATVQRLLALDPRLHVVVIDDASDDDTPAILATLDDPRVQVLRRELPNARVGKGAALNHAFASVCHRVSAHGLDPNDVVVGVFDGDGRVDPGALDAVLRWFGAPDVGGVQIAVRIDNRANSWLARMQDVEFSTYAHIFQRARNRLTTTGLGGNGQFTRLRAMQDLGSEPWADTLTEDLDLGVRLRLIEWRTIFEDGVAVHQQGLHRPRALLRQRTRWFQGHLQAWSHFPALWRSRLKRSAKADMNVHLLMPVLQLLLGAAMFGSFVLLARHLIERPGATLSALASGPLVPWWYLLGFAVTPLVAAAYWRTARDVGFWRGVIYAHAYALYTWVWFFAGWRAFGRQARGMHSWAKTARLEDVGDDAEGGRGAEQPQTPGALAARGRR